MVWWEFALFGALGGSLVEALSVFNRLTAWQHARRTPSGRISKNPTPWWKFLDAPAHIGVGAVRVLLGFATAGIFGATDQITGAFVAVTLGVAAPTVLTQLGNIPQIASATIGESQSSLTDPAPEMSYSTPTKQIAKEVAE